MPRLSTATSPSAVTVPPRVAVVSVTFADVGDVTVGNVVKLFSAELDVPTALVAQARK